MTGSRFALDVGQVRIGVARCDAQQILVVPVATVINDASGAHTIVELCQDYEPEIIYVGLPISLNGRETSSTSMALDFAKQLAKLTTIPVQMVDERLSTSSAAAQLRTAGRSAKHSKSVIDQASAIVILEHALAIEKQSGSPAGTAIGDLT